MRIHSGMESYSFTNMLTIVVIIVVIITTSNIYAVSTSTQTNVTSCDHNNSFFSYACAGKDFHLFGNGITCVCKANTSSSEVILSRLFCMWYNNETVMVGMCPFGRQPSSIHFNSSVTVYEASHMTCGEGRTGRLCGKCSANHSLLFNTYTYDCVSNEHCSKAYWILFFIEQLLPTLLFFLLFVFIDIKAVQSYMIGFIFGAQMSSFQLNLLVFHSHWTHTFRNNSHWPETITEIFSSVNSIWNLNLFFGLIPSYCIENNLDTMQSFTLYYLTGVFPILVLLIAYAITELHRRNFKIIVFLWRPFHVCCTRCRRLFNSQSSLTDVLAMFIILSYTKFVAISSMLLAPNFIYTQSGSQTEITFLYDGTVDYFGRYHTPYAVLAMLVIVFFVLPLPLLLLLYPLTCFQRCLDHCHLRTHLLTAFTDSLQGCYKDGSNNTRDCRYFSAVYFILRVIIIGMYCFLFTRANYLSLLMIMSLLLTLCLVSWLRPYKNEVINKIDVAQLTAFILIIVLNIFYKNVYVIKKMDFSTLIFEVGYCVLLFSSPAIFASVAVFLCARAMHKKWKRLVQTKPTYDVTVARASDSLVGLIADYQVNERFSSS